MQNDVDSASTPSEITANTKAAQCPKCGCEHFDIVGPLIVCGLETYCKVCDDCGHRWDPE